MHGAPLSYAALLKRRGTGAWHGIYVVDNGSTGNYCFPMEFSPVGPDQLAGDFTTSNPFSSAATFTDTTNWMIVGATWDGTTTANKVIWRYKIGAGAWQSELETSPGSNATAAGSGYRHLIGNEAGLGDDANFDIVCVGAIQSQLSQASFESLDMTTFASWQSVFTGSGSWLMGFDTIATQNDRTGNGGNELSRSSGITLVADPPGWAWSAGGGIYLPNRIANRNVGPMALRNRFKQPYWPESTPPASTTQAITPDTGISATSSVSASIQRLRPLPVAGINSTSTVSASVVRLRPITPAAVNATSNVSAAVQRLRPLPVSAVNSTSTVSASLQFLRAIKPGAVNATSNVTASVTKPGSVTYYPVFNPLLTLLRMRGKPLG